MVHLDAQSVRTLGPEVGVPGYDRQAVTPGIVHFGVGAFHRAHQAMYLDRLLEAGGAQEWGICGVGVMERDAALRDVLADQDHLYALTTKAPDGVVETRIIGSIITHLHAPDDPAAVLARMVDPSTRIVSLTITEGGYSINDATGEFDPRDAGTLADLADPDQPPRSVLGFITAALRARREAGTVPFTVMSCDNIQGNGEVCRRAVVAFAERIDPELAAWIRAEVAFPSSMVDRITPVTTDEVRAELQTDHGIEDGWPIRSEAFTQWVLEDHFTAGRPALETVGVQVVDDVEPYELMKLRLLNAGHQAIAHLATLDGSVWVHEAAQDPLFQNFLQAYFHRDAIPTLAPVPGVDLDAYCDELIARFGNEAVRDTLARLATDSSDRIPKFLLPVLRARLAEDADISRPLLVLAGWSRYLEGRTEGGEPIEPNDLRAEELKTYAAREASEPGAFLRLRPVFGDLADDPRVMEGFLAARRQLIERGARACVAAVTP